MKIANKRISAKLLIIILSVSVILAVSVGTAIAYLISETPPVTNTFTPVSVSCQVNQSAENSNITVKNTGDITAYIRATVVINWVSDSGSVYGGAPVEGTDYTVNYQLTDWFKGKDGFYYYSSPVEAGASTSELITTISSVAGTAPEGYSLSVQVLASAIQAEPTDAVSQVWSNVTVGSNGILAP